MHRCSLFSSLLLVLACLLLSFFFRVDRTVRPFDRSMDKLTSPNRKKSSSLPKWMGNLDWRIGCLRKVLGIVTELQGRLGRYPALPRKCSCRERQIQTICRGIHKISQQTRRSERGRTLFTSGRTYTFLFSENMCSVCVIVSFARKIRPQS